MASGGARVVGVVLPREVRGNLVFEESANPASGVVGLIKGLGNLVAGHFNLQETCVTQSIDADGPNDSVESRPESGTAIHGTRLTGCVQVELVPNVVSLAGSFDTHSGELGSAVSHGLVLGVESRVAGSGTLTTVGAEQSVVGTVDDDGTKGTEGAVSTLGASLNGERSSHPIGTSRVGNVVVETGLASISVATEANGVNVAGEHGEQYETDDGFVNHCVGKTKVGS